MPMHALRPSNPQVRAREPRAAVLLAMLPAWGRACMYLVAVLVALASLAACKKASADRSMSPGYGGGYDGEYGGYGSGGDGGEYDLNADASGYPAAEYEAAYDEGPRAPARKMKRGDKSESYREAAPPMSAPGGGAPPADPASTTTVSPERPDAPKSPDDPLEQPGHGRLIIYTAELVISVINVAESMALAERLPAAIGGYVQTRREGLLVLKVPAARLQEAMDRLSQLGRVEAKSLQADDVTAEFVDLESRIRVLQEMQRQLLILLKQAKTVEQALHVRQALDRVTMELEVALGRMRQLGNLIEFSTLTLRLHERSPQMAAPSNDPFPWVDSLGVEATEFN